MTPDQILVTLGGLAVIGFIAWFFWLKRSPGVKASVVSDGYQEQMILVKGGYTPDTIRVAAGTPVRLLFRREETAACSEQVVLPDFGKSAALPTGQVVPVEFMPGEPGSHEFTCQMGMLRGQILVEAV
jgi:plastocyanin domain-containing protein